MEEKNNKVTEERGLVPLGTGDLFWDVATFEHGQRVAKALITSQMVPERFRNVGDVLICLNLSRRMEQVTGNYIDPLMMMQNIYIIKGKPAFETRLAIGFFNALGQWEKINWQVKWQPTDKWVTLDADTAGNYQSARAFAKNLKDNKAYYGEEVSVEMAKKAGWWGKQGSLWPVFTGMMLRYRSAMFFIRQFEPGVLLGLYTREEVLDMAEIEPGVYHVPSEETMTGTLLEDIVAPPAKEPLPATPPAADPAVTTEAPPEEEEWTCTDEAVTEYLGIDSKGCGQSFDSQRGLRRHMSIAHKPEAKPDPEEPPTEPPAEPTEETVNCHQCGASIPIDLAHELGGPKEGDIYFSCDDCMGPPEEKTENEAEKEDRWWKNAEEVLQDRREKCVSLDKEEQFYQVLGGTGSSTIRELLGLKNKQAIKETVTQLDKIIWPEN